MYLNVPRDYQIPSTDPVEFWKDLKKRTRDQIEVDPFELGFSELDVESIPSNFNIEEAVLDYFTWVALFDEDGEEEYDINLDHVPFNK